MALFGAPRQARRDDRELGKGIWRRAHDRFRRGLDRYHQVLEGTDDDVLYNELAEIANSLAALLPRVRAACVRAQQLAPSEGLNVPGRLTAVHRSLSRAANALATAAEAAAISRWDAERYGVASAGVENVRRRAEQVGDDVAAAEKALADADA